MPVAESAIVPALQLTDSEVAFYQREGYLCIPGLITEDAAAALKRDVLDILSVQGLAG